MQKLWCAEWLPGPHRRKQPKNCQKYPHKKKLWLFYTLGRIFKVKMTTVLFFLSLLEIKEVVCYRTRAGTGAHREIMKDGYCNITSSVPLNEQNLQTPCHRFYNWFLQNRRHLLPILLLMSLLVLQACFFNLYSVWRYMLCTVTLLSWKAKSCKLFWRCRMS